MIDDSAITCTENIESCNEDSKAKSHNEKVFNEKKATYKTQSFYILLEFFQLL